MLTENAQPALMAVSMAVLRVLEKEGGVDLATSCAFVAGHSLGEYSALAAARSLGGLGFPSECAGFERGRRQSHGCREPVRFAKTGNACQKCHHRGHYLCSYGLGSKQCNAIHCAQRGRQGSFDDGGIPP